jgi:hypothetical protein
MDRRKRLACRIKNVPSGPILPIFGDPIVRIKRQLGFSAFGKFQKSGNQVSMGAFFEILTGVMFGGQVCNKVYFDIDENKLRLTKPDVVNERRNTIVESKANRSGHQLLILKEQLQRYEYLQGQSKKPRINWVIYRHNFHNIRAYEGTETELWTSLANRTQLAIIIPFSIVLRLYEMSQCSLFHNIARYYESKGHWRYECARVNSTTTNRFFFEPDDILEELGLEGNYNWKRYQLPDCISISGIPITPFPVMFISDVDFDGWWDTWKSKWDKGVPF